MLKAFSWVVGVQKAAQKGNLPLESLSRLALVDDWTSKWEAVVCGKTKPRSTRTSNEEGERLIPLALEVRGGREARKPRAGRCLLGQLCGRGEGGGQGLDLVARLVLRGR